MTPGPVGAHPPGDDRVTPIGARRTSVADLQREVERLSTALDLAETRRRTAERTLADVASMAAADTMDLRARLAELQARLDGATAAPALAAGVGGSDDRTRLRALRRVLLLAGLVIGVALLADGILTIVWQEPITALQQSHDQAALRTDLQGLQRTLAAAPKVARESSAARMRRQALTLLRAKRPDGSALGSVDIPRIGLKTVFVESTVHNALKKGPGHYRGTVLPGLYGTVGLAGHRTTYGAPFRRVDELSPGSRIILRMPYGRFTYKVTGSRITTPSDASALVSHAGTRRLVLTACHPLYSAAKRIVVSARLVSATPA
ncbi:class E sortase [Baekduia sp.]|uniref:class E sortase n=1 Tax=Baekduia sp. TaxID=2600305 RepID=UPI002E0408D6|nr:class E sortase [Baekduia sp.]